MSKVKEALWEKQNLALRHPSELFGTSFKNAGITKQTLSFKASASFTQLLHKLKITLIVSREYENLVLALNAPNAKKIKQSFFHLPHPSGIAVDRTKNIMYVAATRNPNQVIEFKVSTQSLNRLKVPAVAPKILIPARTKYYPGQYYFHDLVLNKGKLYANSVGMNAIVPIDFSTTEVEKPIWWPKCIEQKGKPDTSVNYIQLNSIAFGKDLKSSFFSASGTKIGSTLPGDLDYPVDKLGAIFSGKTREPIGFGLTRPHSARLHKGKIWVANSGYGEVGYFKNKQFVPVFKFNGWTRGLCFIDSILFVAISRVLPRFRHYAPGIKSKTQTCAVVAIDTIKKEKIGEIEFPYGNQIFAIDYFNSDKCEGFAFTSVEKSSLETDIFSVSL
ncbi:MAG TPA: DUF4915 domain-containing protein [Bacteroidia bacterium]|jgi:uncharacterized protein (TIGR03032 family)|nr:DUF4915 domain-containing protein [Bacteroidia bacterium]